ncbi:hypothetical protein [Minwuia sp.]|uniref:hypothetical protein n=1 Tax=Minwuia sp. TaxID=2493630 RepID=UPI003A8FC271
MRLNIILLVLLVLLGLGISVLLVPRDKDVALLKLRSDEADEARQVLLEQYDRGDRSVAVIASLAELAIGDGEIPTAVELLEAYVRNNPKDIAARRRLAEYYRFDQRRDDYVAMLAEVVAIDGVPQERRLLVDLYRVRGEYEALLSGLNDLMTRGIADRSHYWEAVQLAASQGKYDQALAASEQMWRRFPESFDARTVRLYAVLADAAGKAELAEQTVARLASGETGPAAIVPVIREISDRGQAKLGLLLLRRFEDDLQRTPALLVAWARMQQSLDQELVALERLRGLEERGELPETAVPVLLDLVILSGDVDLIDQVVSPRDMADLTDFRLRAVMDRAVFERRTSLLQQFLDQAPAAFRDREPALVAEVLIGLGRMEEAEAEVARARSLKVRRLDQLLRLARAEIRLGQEAQAAETLDRIAGAADLDDQSMRALATLYIETERTTQGLRAFRRLQRERPSLAVDAGWARLAAREGLDTELLTWMKQRSGLDEDLLSDIVFLSSPDRAPRSALEAATRLYREHPGRDSRRLYAEALVANGRHAEALPVLEELLPGSDEDAEAYVAALVAANRRADALAFLKQRGADGPIAPRLADDLFSLAVEAGEMETAYAEALRQDYRKLEDETLAFWIETATNDRRFDLIDRIVAQTDPAFMAARPVLAARIALARDDRSAAREWAEKALLRADLRNAEMIALAGIFDALGETDRSLALLQGLADDPATPAFAIGNLGAQYLKLGKAAEGVQTFRRLIETRTEPQVMESWARLEAVAGDAAAALAWLKTAEAPSAQVLADLYFMATERGAEALAFEAARRYVDAYPGTDSRRVYATALIARGRAAEALPVLEKLLPGDDETVETYVGALNAVGRKRDAFTYLEQQRNGGKLPLRLADDFIGLALELDRAETAFAEVAQHDLRRFDDGVVAALVERAAADRNFDLIDQMVAAVGPDFLAQRPVLAARIELARGNDAAARDWADRAAGRDDLNNQDRLALASVWAGLGATEKSLALLKGLADDPATPAYAIADLGAQYLSLGKAKEGLSILRRLIEDRREPQVLEAWARLEAAEGEPARVLDWLASTPSVSGQALADVHYLAAERRADELAFEAGRTYHERYPGPESRRIYATALIARGRAEDAIPILQQLLPGDDEVAEAYAGALGAVDRKAEALAFLRARTDGEKLPVRIADDYMALAIELDQSKLAYAEARRHVLSDFDDDTIASLAENAAEDGDFELIDQIVAQTGPAFWEARPVMAARIEVARGNEAKAREWAERAAALDDLSNADVLRLAKVFSDLNDIERSLALLEGIAADPRTPSFAYADLSAQYLQLGKAEQGLPVFRRLIAQRSEPQVMEGWARLETKAGSPQRVFDWLREDPEPTRQALTDLYFLAAERKANRLALAAADDLFERFPGNESRLIRGQALIGVGRGKEAVAVLRPLLPGSREVRAAYVTALGQSGSATDLKAFAVDALKDPDLDPEIRSALLFGLLENGAADIALPQLRELAQRDPATWEAAYLDALRQAGTVDERVAVLTAKLDAGPPPAQRDLLLFELLETGGPARALPYLRRAAEADPAGTWPSTYEEALTTLGRDRDLIDWLVRRAQSPDVPGKQRREIAFRLLDLNARDQAEQVFLGLAANAKPSSPDVEQLVFLWGPKPPKRGLDWLVRRAGDSAQADRAGWLRLLANVRAFDEVVALGMRPAPANARDPKLQPLITALVETRRQAEVSRILDPIIEQTDDPRLLLRMADWAEQAERSKTAVAAYQRAISRIGDDPEALLKAGRAFTFAGRAELAVETLERYFRTPGNKAASDHRPWYYYGQSLSQMNRQPEARDAYRRMLAVMDRSGANDFESRRMRATGHEAIGDGERAVQIYEGLLAERPDDRSLIADFAALLIELRRYDRAELLLGQN